MRYRSKIKEYFLEIQEPKGADWISVGDIRLWLPTEKRSVLNTVLPDEDMDIVLRGPGWSIARSALNFLLHLTYGGAQTYQIDWVDKVGEGINREVYRADVIFPRRNEHKTYAVSLISHDADSEAGQRMIREFALIDSLRKEKTSFTLHESMGIIWCNGSLISIRSFVFGIPLELRAPKSNIERPWEIMAKVAAEIHNLPSTRLPEGLIRHSTRKEHLLSILAQYKVFDEPVIQDVLMWLTENITSQEETVLVHGDLMGQNIYRTTTEEIFVLDWEYAFIGDPAYDLAIVTRGIKNPFQVSGGLHYLIDSYLASEGKNITSKDVHIHELLLCLGWYKDTLEPSGGGHSPDHYLQQLKSLFKRIKQ